MTADYQLVVAIGAEATVGVYRLQQRLVDIRFDFSIGTLPNPPLNPSAAGKNRERPRVSGKSLIWLSLVK